MEGCLSLIFFGLFLVKEASTRGGGQTWNDVVCFSFSRLLRTGQNVPDPEGAPLFGLYSSSAVLGKKTSAALPQQQGQDETSTCPD